MAKDSITGGEPLQEPTPQEKAKAAKWFQHGKTVADTHNYDYGIECYINGLRAWPDAVEEGHKPLRTIAFARHSAGKKKPGMLETLKFSTVGAGRDALEGMLTAETLLAKDPTNLIYMEIVLKSAHKAGCVETCIWLGPIFLEEVLASPRANQTKLPTVLQVFEELADRYNAQGNIPQAVKCYDVAVKAVEMLARLKPTDGPTQDMYRNLSGKLTIIKGKFETGDFRESLHEADKQRELRDRERMVQDDSRLEELVASARKGLEENPNETGKVFAVIDLMLRRGRVQDENDAIRLLVETFSRSKVYQFKMRADEIRMRQLYRQTQEIKASGDRAAASEHLRKILDYEIGVYKERMQQYPTEGRFKYELGKRYFMAQRFDDAVPVLQQARTDPRHRMMCLSLIAQCFYHKGYFDQGINVLLDAIKNHDVEADDISKDLHYWLGRSQEASGQKDGAIQTYGQIIQWDYNYRDVRQRLEVVQQARKNEAGQ